MKHCIADTLQPERASRIVSVHRLITHGAEEATTMITLDNAMIGQLCLLLLRRDMYMLLMWREPLEIRLLKGEHDGNNSLWDSTYEISIIDDDKGHITGNLPFLCLEAGEVIGKMVEQET